MTIPQKFIFLILVSIIGQTCFASEKDKYLKSGEICYWRSGKYRGEVCRKPKDGEDISMYPTKQYLPSTPSPQIKKDSGIPSCERIYWTKYYEVLGDSIANPMVWQLDGANSAEDYAHSRARLWLSIVKKQYKGCN